MKVILISIALFIYSMHGYTISISAGAIGAIVSSGKHSQIDEDEGTSRQINAKKHKHRR